MVLLASTVAARLTPKANIDAKRLDQLAKMVGWILLGYLYLRLWDMLSSHYTYTPGRSEAGERLPKGSLAMDLWIGEMMLGIIVPLTILLVARLRHDPSLRLLALFLVVGGVVAYRWDTNLVGQLVVMSRLPQSLTPLYTTYRPSPVEIMTAIGVAAYGVLAFSLGVRYLGVVDYGVAAETQPIPQPSIIIPTTP